MSSVTDRRAQMMGTAKVPVAIVRLAIPAIVSMLILSIYNMADTYFVSLVSEGDLEVAAVSVYIPIMMFTQAISILFAAGGAVYVSRLLGAGEKQKAEQVATLTVCCSFVMGIAVLVFGLIFIEPLLYALGASSETIGLAKEYAIIMLIVAPVQMTNMAFNNLLRSEGNAVRSMAGMVIGAVLNIALDPIFILVFGMGVSGAAVATAISQCVSFVILSSNYIRKSTVVKLNFRKLKFDGKIIAFITKIGISTFLVQIFAAISIAIINIVTVQFGDGAIAAIGVVNRLQFVGFGIVFGFSQGFQPVAAYNFGAHRYDRLKTALTFGMLVSVLLGACVSVVFWFNAPQITGAFTVDPQVHEMGIQALRWFTVSFPLTAFSLMVMMVYQAIGKAVGATIVSVCRQGICLIPIVLIFSSLFGFNGILASPVAADIIAGAISAVFAVRALSYVKKTRIEHEQLQA